MKWVAPVYTAVLPGTRAHHLLLTSLAQHRHGVRTRKIPAVA